MVAQTLLQGLTGAIQAQADRPIKTSATTTTTSKPLEYSDLLARRNQIGAERAMLNEALKQRETFGYGLANALASMPAQQGAGSWLGDFARGFGSAFNARANAAIDRAKQDYEAAQADLATALAFDKAMGDRQIQSEEIGYTPLPMGGSGGGSADRSYSYSATKSNSGGQKLTPASYDDWDYWFKNFDKARPSEAAYRNKFALQTALHNTLIGFGGGDRDEQSARDDFSIYHRKNFLPIARETLKGAGQITDFEDVKYTRWIEEAGNDPRKMKDAQVRIVMDVGGINGWTDAEKRKGLEIMNLLSNESDLLPSEIEQNPLRVKEYNLSGNAESKKQTNTQAAIQQPSGIDAILKKYGATRVE